MSKEIILASASPRRRELLAQIGLQFRVLPGNAEENVKSADPAEMVKELSALKASQAYESLSDREKAESIVIGADTVVSQDGQILGKPGSEERAVRMLSSLQGRTHHVYTGVTLIWQEERQMGGFDKKSRTFFEDTLVTMYPMSAEEIEAYVSTGEPMDKAGAYGIQGGCAAWIQRIEGDYNNVVGLPVGRLYQELKKIDSWKGIKEHD